MLEIIKDDLFNISGAVKSIDDRYYIAFNKKTHRFELHHSEQLFSTYCLTFPYSGLDRRAVTHVLYTRAERSKKIFEEIIRNNEKNTEDSIREAADMIKL